MSDIPPPVTPSTVGKDISECGLIVKDAKIFATDIFIDGLQTCRDIANEKLNYALKTLSTLTMFLPDQKHKFKSLNQQVTYQFRIRINTTTIRFPVSIIADLLIRVKTHKLFIHCSDTISSTAKTGKLTKDTKWEDCDPSFSNCL